MKVLIEATQEEFDQKRPLLIKALAKRPRTRYDRERSAQEPRQPYFQAQAELLDHHNARFREMLEEIKREVSEVVEGGAS